MIGGSTHRCKVINTVIQDDGYMQVLLSGDTWCGLVEIAPWLQKYCKLGLEIYVDLDNARFFAGLGPV